MIANSKVLVDTALRLTSNTTLQGAAQNKGTATNLQVTILAGGDGANPVAGTVTNTIQGSNVSTSGWATVTADKGTIANSTVAGAQTLDFANLQFQFYRIALSAAASTTCDTYVGRKLQGLQDSFDNTVQ
jgi:hypothetical protein